MFDILDRSDTSRSSVRRWVKKMSQNGYVYGFFAVITLWVLVADDLRLACMPPSADLAIGTLSMACMFAFVFEIIMYSIGTKAYLGSFFFWLDVLATISMILDIPRVNEVILQSAGNSDSLDSTALARATRMSRVGTKAGRIAAVSPRPLLWLSVLAPHALLAPCWYTSMSRNQPAASGCALHAAARVAMTHSQGPFESTNVC
jgi:hypothetical protein